MSSVEPVAPGAGAAHEPATIVTFYSYKGGVGRTMALANVAWLLAGEGCKVLVVDWDLESPGLHRFLRPFLSDPELARLTGVVEMVRDYGEAVEQLAAMGLGEAEYEQRLLALLDVHTDVGRHSDTVRWSHFPVERGSIDFLGPGLQDGSYSGRVALFDWARFYEQQAGKRFIQTLRDRLRGDDYDYVLIDSRTGHSDNAGVCTLWLPDVVVAGFNLSNQSIEGTAAVARQVHEDSRRTGRDIRILPVPMRVEAVDRGKAARRRTYMERQFAGVVGPLLAGAAEGYWRQVEVPHSAGVAYEEVLLPFTLDPGEPSLQLQAYLRIAQEISRGKVAAVRPVPETPRQEFQRRFEEVRPSGQRTAKIVHAPRDRQWADWIRAELARIGINCEMVNGSGAGPERPSGEPTFTVVVVSPALPSAPEYGTLSDQYLKTSRRLGAGHRTPSIVAVRVEDARVGEPVASLQGPDLQGQDEQAARGLLLGWFGPGEHDSQEVSAPRQPADGGARFPGRMPKPWKSPQRNFTFQGREQYIEQLRDALVPGRQAMPVVLTGQLGVGKSQIALEFAYRFAADYDVVWWITADSVECVREELAGLVDRLEVTTRTSPAAVQDALDVLADGTQQHRRFLAVYDNARRPSDLAGLLPSGGSTHVLITSDTDDWSSVGRQLDVVMPTEAEARQLLGVHFPGLPAALATDILDVSGRLPQTVEQAAALIKGTGLPPREAVTRYRQQMTDGSGTLSAAGYPAEARRTWALSLEALREQEPVAERVLRLLAHLSPSGVSMDLLRSPAALEWLSLSPNEPPTPVTAGAAFRALADLVLAQVNYASERVVGDAMGLAFLRDTMTQEEASESRAAVHRILAAFSPSDPEVDEPRHVPVFAELDQHVGPSGAERSDDPEVRRWLVNQVRSRRQARRLDWALELATRLREHWDPQYDADDVLLLRLSVELANIHRDASRFREAERVNVQALERLRATLGLHHPYTLRSALGRGAELRALGQVQEAFAEDQSTHEILAETFGPDNPFTMMAEGNLALSLAMVGMTAEALDLNRETYGRRKRVLGVDNPLTWRAAAQLGNRYRESGEYGTSLRRLQYVYNEAVARFGESDPTTLGAARGLAATLRRLGSPEEISAARKLDSDTVAGCLAYGGPGHHETLATKLALAADLRRMGDHDKARGLARECLEQYATWESGHPFQRICQVNLALCERSASLVDSTELSDEGWQGLVATLGADHPITLVAALDHANALVFAGESEAALDRDRDTYTRLKDRLTDEHPLTLCAATNLQDSEARVQGIGTLTGVERNEIDLDMPYI